MNVSQMLHQMCHQVLSDADVKAIGKSRGFSAQEAASRALFENFFLSDIGVAAAMSTLSAEEAALLHRLRLTGETVDVSFFARIYSDESVERRHYYPTFTQRYRDVLKQVQAALVRKGVLFMAEDITDLNAETKMERWRFRLPPEFERFLPPLIRDTRTLAGPGDWRADVPRDKLRELIDGPRPGPLSAEKEYTLRLADGQLQMGQREFRARHLLEWQQAGWAAAVPTPTPKKEARAGKSGKAISPVAAVTYVFDQLAAHEWVRPEQLALPLRLFCDAHLDGADVCAAGWQWGYLARQKADGITYYQRPAPAPAAEADVDPARYLTVTTDPFVTVRLDTVPYASLELLARLSSLKAIGGQLVAAPSLVRLGRTFASVRKEPLVGWLREHAPAFRPALETVEQRWGRQIVHENLLLARVGDVGLKVQLERAFPEQMVFLPDGYVAFPTDLLAAVEKVVTKSGCVIRTVQHAG